MIRKGLSDEVAETIKLFCVFVVQLNVSSFQSDNFNQSGFCCAPGVRKKKKKKKKKGKSDDIPNPYGLHTSEKQAAFWNSTPPTGSEI